MGKIFNDHVDSFIEQFINYSPLIVLLSFVFWDSFHLFIHNDSIHLGFVIIWVVIFKILKYTSKVSFFCATLLIWIVFVEYVLGNFETVDKMLIWSFMLLGAGLIQGLLEVNFEKRKK